jgi:hypothetical protein
MTDIHLYIQVFYVELGSQILFKPASCPGWLIHFLWIEIIYIYLHVVVCVCVIVLAIIIFFSSSFLNCVLENLFWTPLLRKIQEKKTPSFIPPHYN